MRRSVKVYRNSLPEHNLAITFTRHGSCSAWCGVSGRVFVARRRMERVGSPQDVVKGSSCEGESLCEGVPNTSVEQLLDALVVLESEVAQPQQPSTLMPRGVVLSSAVQDIAAGHERTAAASGTNAVGLLTAPQQAPASSSGAAAAMAVEQAGEQDGEQALFYDFRLDESGAQVAPSRPTAAKGKKRKVRLR